VIAYGYNVGFYFGIVRREAFAARRRETVTFRVPISSNRSDINRKALGVLFRAKPTKGERND
jgi:hypothetical protein